MTTDTFRRDYRQMTEQGVKFTPEDIVRLNALSVRVRLSANAARSVHLPRLAYLPRVSWFRSPPVLREPTIAHDLWLEEMGRWVDYSDNRVFLFVHGYALARRAEDLPDASHPGKVVDAVFKYAARHFASYTHAQLSAAVDYALFGADWTVGETAPQAEDRKNNRDDKIDRGVDSPTIGLLVDMKMLRLPISVDEAKRMTASELAETIDRAWTLDGKFDRDRAKARALGEYVRAREEIRSRSTRSEKDAPDKVEDGNGEEADGGRERNHDQDLCPDGEIVEPGSRGVQVVEVPVHVNSNSHGEE